MLRRLNRLPALVLLFTLVTSCLVVAPANANPTKLEVQPEEAIAAATAFVARYAPIHRPEWVGAIAAAPVLYETPKGKPDSYVVALKDQATMKDLGYVVVGATNEHSPIIESSTGPVPHRDMSLVANVAAQHGYDKSSMRLVHAGPALFVAEYRKDPGGHPLFIQLPGVAPISEDYLMEPAEANDASKAKARTQWERVRQGKWQTEATISSITSYQISNFPTGFDQSLMTYGRQGCGPLAGATIYWWYAEYQGYPGLRTQGYDWLELANHMYVDMNTKLYGTSPSAWASGMQTHARSHAGYSNFTVQAVDTSLSSIDRYPNFESEILQNRPTGVYIGLSATYNDTFEYHIMPTYGVYDDPANYYRQIDVATNWGYASSFDYDYYRARYTMSFMWVRP